MQPLLISQARGASRGNEAAPCSVRICMAEREGANPVAALVVIVLLVVAGAILIPGLLARRRADNERTGGSMLASIRTAQEDFRRNDRDGNGANDFWTADVAGLHFAAKGGPIRLIGCGRSD